MPTHSCNEIARDMTRVLLKMVLDGQEIVGNSIGNGGLHGVRVKLEEWEIMVGQPQHQPTVIGGTWALIVVHGTTALPAIMNGRIAGYPNLLRRGSAPWRGGTVIICSQS